VILIPNISNGIWKTTMKEKRPVRKCYFLRDPALLTERPTTPPRGNGFLLEYHKEKPPREGRGGKGP